MLFAVTLGVGIALAAAFVYRPYAATVRLVTHDRAFATEAEMLDFVAMATAPALLAKIAEAAPDAASARNIESRCRVSATALSPMISVSVTARDVAATLALVNAFADEVARCADEWLARNRLRLENQTAAAQSRLAELQEQFTTFTGGVAAHDIASARENIVRQLAEDSAALQRLRQQLDQLEVEQRQLLPAPAATTPALQSVQSALEEALTRYTEEHPRVKELRASLAALERNARQTPVMNAPAAAASAQAARLQSRQLELQQEISAAQLRESTTRAALETFSKRAAEFAQLQSEYSVLSRRRDDLMQARVAAAAKAVDIWRLAGPADVTRAFPIPLAIGSGIAGALAGLLAGLVGTAISRRAPRYIRDEQILQEATGLPVLAALPALHHLSAAEREYWSTETLATIESVARPTGSCLTCGIISAHRKEGRSTWINLLADAGLRKGYRVLVISQPRTLRQRQIGGGGPAEVAGDGTTELFALEPQPAQPALARYLVAPNAAHVSLQKQWHHAFAAWANEENALILVELPPASTPDALLLSSAVPNVVWLAEAGVAGTADTARCIRNLNNIHCNLVGAALNKAARKEPAWPARSFCAGLAAVLIALGTAQAQPVTNAPPPDARSNALSGLKVPVLAPWQERLTLGPGDVFDISLYGQSDSARLGLIIAPDGRISYLQASDVMAAGLTVDELRARLEAILGKFHLAPRIIIVPTSFQSKKYHVLGNVVQHGTFTLDRPITVIEAIATAGGFIPGPEQRGSFNLADLSHAFLMRRQPDGSFTREQVDFEGLFLRGELQQNRLIAPDDYIYFPPRAVEDVYVLGETGSTGVVPFTPDLTVIGAIASRGGFTERAFRQRVLVVRGSLEQPETFVINTAKTLRAVAPDFALQPRDIIYVSSKPWAKAEELLNAAASDFVRAVVTTWTGRNIEPVLR